MAFCNSCGKEFDDSSVFCPYCGTPFEKTKENSEPADAKQPVDSVISKSGRPESSEAPDEPAQKEQRPKGLIAVIIALAVILFIILSILVVCLLKIQSTKNTNNTNPSTDIDDPNHLNTMTQTPVADPVSTSNTPGNNSVSTPSTSVNDPVSTSSTQVSDPVSTPSIDMDVLYAAYCEVLHDHEFEMRMIENSPLVQGHSMTDLSGYSVDSCALTDLTGDGFPELIILYCSDDNPGQNNSGYYGFGDISIYTMIPGKTTATEILHISQAVSPTAQGSYSYSDLVLLSNGNLIVEKHDGDEDFYYKYAEYALEGFSFNPINELKYSGSYYDDNDKYLINDKSVSEADFTAQINSYKSSFSSVLAMSPWYEYRNDNSSGNLTDWEQAVYNTPNNILSFDEAWKRLNSNQNSDLNLTEENVYLGVKNYLDYIDWDLVEQYNGYLASAPEQDGVFVTVFRSYTGAILTYYTFTTTGFTYETEYGPFNDYTETMNGNHFYIQDYM